MPLPTFVPINFAGLFTASIAAEENYLSLAKGSADTPDWAPLLGVGAGVLFMAAFSVVNNYWMASASGWSDLAERLPKAPPLQGTKLRCKHAKVRGKSYGGSMLIHWSDTGCSLQPTFPFKFGHPRIFLPWGMVTSFTHDSGFRWKGFNLVVSGFGRITLAADGLEAVLARHVGSNKFSEK